MSEYSNIIQGSFGSAPIRAVAAIDDNPDEAARALDLSSSTGVPAPAIAGDLEGFERQHKAKLAGDIVRNNPQLADYIDSHPLAAAVSNDDLGNLDKVSEKATALAKLRRLQAPRVMGIPTEIGERALSEGSAGLIAGWGEPGAWMTDAEVQNHRLLGAIGLTGELPFRALNALMQGALGLAHGGATATYEAAGGSPSEAQRFARDITGMAEMQMMGTGVHGIRAPEPIIPPKTLEAIQAAKPWLNEGLEPPRGVHPEIDRLKTEANKVDLEHLDDALKDAQASATRERNPDMFAGFIRQHVGDAKIGISGDRIAEMYGDKIPQADDNLLGWVPGIKEQLDAYRETGSDIQVPIADWLARVDPAVAKDLHDDIRVQPGNITKAEAELVAPKLSVEEPSEPFIQTGMTRLYRGETDIPGEARPIPEWLSEDPRVKATLNATGRWFNADRATAEHYNQEHGDKSGRISYVDIPTEDVPKYLSANQPEAKKFSAAGREQEEYFLPADVANARRPLKVDSAKSVVDSPLAQTRAAASLEPLFSIGDRKLTLERFGKEIKDFENFHDFQIMDDKGNAVGVLNLSMQGKQVYVEGIEGLNGFGPRDFGPSLMRDLLRQIKAEFPDAESITGHRVSGARDKAGTFNDPRYQSPVVKLDTMDNVENFTQALQEQQWTQIGKTLMADFRPRELYTANEAALTKAVETELARIVPKDVKVEEAHGIKPIDPADKGRIRGAYQQFTDRNPIIVYALNGPDVIGTARHEAIHHLRAYGFFNDAEWKTLEKAAQSEGWIEKYRIDKRYKDAPDELKLEEAIAEGYRDWTSQQDNLIARAKSIVGIESPLDTIFRRIKELLSNIGDKFKEILGHEPTWQELFEDTHAGEIGSREGTGPRNPASFKAMLDAGEERSDMLKANATGLDVTSFKRIQKLIQQRHAEDVAAAEKRAQAEQTRQQTKEWKDNRKEVRAEVDQSIRNRPDVAADLFFGSGELFGQKLARGYRLRTEDLTPEQREALPKHYQAKDGIPPDEAAKLFGYGSGDVMVQKLAELNRLKQPIRPQDLVVARKMPDNTVRYGKPGQIHADLIDPAELEARPFFPPSTTAMGFAKPSGEFLSREEALAHAKMYEPDRAKKANPYGMQAETYQDVKASTPLSTTELVKKLVEQETDRQMEQKYGLLEKNIMEDAKDQALSETQLNILAEELHGAGMMAKVKTVDADVAKAWVKARFAELPIGDLKSDGFLRDVGKHGRDAERSLIAGKPVDAVQSLQNKYMSALYAVEARKLEKEMARFDRDTKRFSKRVVTGMEPEYTNFIHQIMMQIGKPVRRSEADLKEQIAASGHADIESFVASKEADLRELPVADFLLDEKWQKPYDTLSVDEFRAVRDSIKALAFNARDEMKIYRAGEAADLVEKKTEMMEQLEQFQIKHYDAKGGRWLGPIPPTMAKVIRTYVAAHMQLEGLFNRWDKFDPRGVWNQYIMRDLVEGANQESAWRTEYSKKLLAIDDKADLSKAVDNQLFRDPLGGGLMNFTRKNLRTVLLNAGNISNLTKMAKGYGLEPKQVWDWVNTHATKEDWAWAQKIGDIFAEIKSRSDTMYRSMTGGVAPESIEIKPLDTAQGKQAGWYYPIIFHPEFEGKSKKLMGGDAIEGENYVRATTPAGYTKGRTGYIAPLALDLDAMPGRIASMLHDIALRPAVINASKVFYDKDVRSKVGAHYGVEYRDMLVPYLKDVANSANSMSKAQHLGAQASEFIRQNMISTLVGLNPGTVMKHGPTAFIQSMMEVGPVNFLKALKSLTSVDEATGDSNWAFAMKESQELQRRERNYQETLSGATESLMPTSKFGAMRQSIINLAAKPVALSDKLSAVPTWLAQYTKSMEENGGIHGDAVFDADRAVRRAHGSTAITNRPVVMRGGAGMQWFSSVYGFFNHIMNRQAELVWKSGDALGLVKDGEYKEAMSKVPELSAMLFAYIIAPAIIEELVSPLASSDNESWGKKAAKGIGFTLGASWVGIRDLSSAMLNGRDPSAGLISTAGQQVVNLARDYGKQQPLSKEHAGKIIQDATGLFGTATGLTPLQLGRSARFGYGVATGVERPKGPWGWMVGMRYGTLDKHSRTFEEWRKHH